MGGIICSFRDTISTVASLINIISSLNTKYKAVFERISSSPGLPNPNPTSSYWLDDAPFPHLINIQQELPSKADVVIIGSGIASVAATKSILELCRLQGSLKQPHVVVLEARQICSGATGRNGGHIKCTPYEVFAMMKARLGAERAAAVTRFQMKHLPVLVEMGKQYPLGEVREVETVDLFLEEKGWKQAVEEVEEAKNAMPEFEHKVWNGEEARHKFGVNDHIKGAISYDAGALWPYRLVTSIWDELLKTYPNLTISTHTPVDKVSPTSSASHPYQIVTSRGVIQARHVLHATNGFASQLLPSLRESLTGTIAHMSAQRPGAEFPTCNGNRSWSVVYSPGVEYITQRPDVNGVPGDLMIGGGLFRSKDQGLDQVGVWDDGKMDTFPLMHIRGCMQTIFEPKWGNGEGLLKAWTGILGVTGDFMPFIGRVPETETRILSSDEGGIECELASSGQWIAAGFCGEGMVWAWLCGTAVGVMIAGRDKEELDEIVGRPGGKLDDWFLRRELQLDAARLKRANLKNLAKDVM